jgi:hypothetical protein
MKIYEDSNIWCTAIACFNNNKYIQQFSSKKEQGKKFMGSDRCSIEEKV